MRFGYGLLLSREPKFSMQSCGRGLAEDEIPGSLCDGRSILLVLPIYRTQRLNKKAGYSTNTNTETSFFLLLNRALGGDE